MNKKKIVIPLLLLLAVLVYFVVFYKDKDLRYIPENVDAVFLVDTKKLTGQYLFKMILYPSHWSGKKSKNKNSGSLSNCGIKIPDFLQVFHIKGTRFSEWYTVIELKDPPKFIAFLKKQNFTDKKNGYFQKDQISVFVIGDLVLAGTSDKAFGMIQKQLFQKPVQAVWNADQFIHNTLGSFSFISEYGIQNFAIDLNDDDIEIKNNSNSDIFNFIAAKTLPGNHCTQLELDKDNIRSFARFFNKGISDSLQASYLKVTVDLKQVNDTIVSYDYDENFNEIEKTTFQKITQPQYIIEFQTKDPEKTGEYFQSKKWINSENQFTAIPFQPNEVKQHDNGFIIQSSGNRFISLPPLKQNYILIRNNSLLYSSLKTLNETEKRIISDIDYVLYANKSQNYWLKIKAKKGKLPLILRW